MIRKNFSVIAFLLIISLSGCALFGHKKEEDPTANASQNVFETQRQEQEKLAEMTASYGRSTPSEKKKIDPGQTFLLSSKAKEIYANTERE